MRSKVDYKEIAKLLDMMEERNLSEFELEIEGFKVRITKNPKRVVSTKENDIEMQDSPIEENSQIDSTDEDEGTSSNNRHYIRSPMIGTFYRAPDPNSPPFVEIGDNVKSNQTVCIIEAMKLMNEIETEMEGTVEKIYIESGKPVEYGQKLFLIKSQ